MCVRAGLLTLPNRRWVCSRSTLSTSSSQHLFQIRNVLCESHTNCAMHITSSVFCDTCSYLVSFLLDSTAGLFIIFLLLKAVAWLVAMFDLSPLRSGVYGKLLCVCALNFACCKCSVLLQVVLSNFITGWPRLLCTWL